MFTVKQRRAIIHTLLVSLILSSFGFIAAPQTAKAAALPEIFITEIIPNAKNIATPKYDEAYEMIELFNNSDQTVRLGDLKIVNQQGLNETDKEDNPWTYDAVEAEKTIPPYGVMVVWLKQSTNPFTFDDFYNFQLTKNPDLKRELVAVAIGTGVNLHNTMNRTLIIYKNNIRIVKASYIGLNSEDTADDKAIHYSYPKDGSIAMKKISVKVASTPGQVSDGQLPLPEINNPTVAWGDSKATISWIAPIVRGTSNYTHINIYDQSGTKVAGPITDTTSAVINDLVNGNDYTFTVKTVNDQITEGISFGVTLPVGKPSAIPLTEVENPTAVWGNKQVLISWKEPNIDNDFKINIYDMNGTLIGTVSKGTNSFNVTALENGVDYQFKLTTASQGRESSGVVMKTGYPTDGGAPAKPTGLTGSSVDGEIILHWTANTDADLAGYKIYFGDATKPTEEDKPISDKRIDADATQTSIHLRFSDFEDGYSYRFTLSAVDTSRLNSEKSAPVSVKYEGGPNGFKGIAGDKSVTLSWNPLSIDLLGYKVYQNNVPVSASVYTVTYSTYSYTVAGLTNGTKYNFAVTGVKDRSETPKSTTIELTPFAFTGIKMVDVPSTMSVGAGATVVVKALYDGKPEEEVTLNITYTSGDPSIVSIDTSGQAKALKPGKTYIEAKHGGFSAKQDIEVKAELTSLAISGIPTGTFFVGDKAQLKITATFNDNAISDVTTLATLTVTPISAANISSAGLLEAKSKGEASITASLSGKSVTTRVSISDKPAEVSSLEMTGIPTTFYAGDKVQLKVNAKYSDNTTKDVTASVVYTSSRPDIVAVSSSGLLEGKVKGETNITAAYGNKSVETKVTITDRTNNSCSNCVFYGSAPRTNSASSATLGSDAFKTSAAKDAAGRTVTKLEVDASRLSSAFSALNDTNNKVTLEYSGNEPVVQVSLPAEALQQGGKNKPDSKLTLRVGGVSYEIPLKAFNFEALAKELGTKVEKMNITFVFAAQSGQEADRVKAIAAARNAKPLTAGYDFAIQITAAGKTVEVKQLNGEYAIRTLEVTGNVDPSKSTGVLIDPARGTMYFVPTIFTTTGGKTQASIMSQSNSIYTVVELSRTFPDLKGHWSQNEVELLATKLVVSGVDDHNFAPDAQITRAQFATMLVTALGLSGLADNAKVTSKFNDVAASDWFASAVAVASEKGLISGYENNEFRPNANVTREEMAVMIARALQLVDKKNGPTAKLIQFSDGTSISSWASASVAKAVDTGIIQGVSDTSFEPGQNATRAQAATMLKRMLQYLKFMN
ncbi:S-layer homology domain-containing protein [Paenibacillus allorhizosphaerae]|uniref:Uncharacterized protein n=1 Tax=Paenibacillus allorhizosphaerae TaxID=2849866 RepID=A0ABM8VIE2_9BACL|nr:S-layer homology domain-containing protein [Paenibacillus allorhizosphaerae]CAG7644110.1 hypothetical protein PAECIP111802_03157 [Paenibacillus allorhizosphaerae]